MKNEVWNFHCIPEIGTETHSLSVFLGFERGKYRKSPKRMCLLHVGQIMMINARHRPSPRCRWWSASSIREQPERSAADGSLFWLAAQLKRNDSQWRSNSSDNLALIRLEESRSRQIAEEEFFSFPRRRLYLPWRFEWLSWQANGWALSLALINWLVVSCSLTAAFSSSLTSPLSLLVRRSLKYSIATFSCIWFTLLSH